MNKNNIFSFVVGVILAVIVMLLFFNKKEEVNTQMTDIQGELESWDSDGDVQGIKDVWEFIKSEAKWLPSGSVTVSDVLEGKTFYNKSREIQTGTYKPQEYTFLGDATEGDVLSGKKFYSNTNEILTGTLTLPTTTSTVLYRGNASVSDVLSGKTFYSNTGVLKTGTYTPPSVSYLGDALETEVMLGKRFYSNSGILLTGAYTPPTVSYLGDASLTDVLLGKKFYSDSGTLLTGTYTPPTVVDYSLQQYSNWDDYAGVDLFNWDSQLTEDYQDDESEWTKISNDIWKDTRTDVYWSSDQTQVMIDAPVARTNEFDMSTCDFFTSTPRGSYDGNDPDCGNAINWCATLDFGGRTDWYLPSQKELMQAYINGMYNQAGDTLQEAAEFTIGTDQTCYNHCGYYWSSSEVSYDSPSAWRVHLTYGYTYYADKPYTATGVRCVSRD